MKNKIVIASIMLATLLTTFAKKVEADMYGETGEQPQIIVDKKVKPIKGETWFDNLSSDEAGFAAKSLVFFKVIVKNSGEKELNNITVVDTLPSYVNFVLGPGTYNKDNRQIEWKIDKLVMGEAKEFFIRVQVFSADQIPNKTAFPVVNRVKASSDNVNDEDTSQFFIDTRILGETLPKAGADLVLVTTIALSLAGMGIFARKFGRGEIFLK